MEDSKALPLVTVVIPMFNAFPFIVEMLECMEKQTYNNWELIIVDDGSTDESVSTVNGFVEKDPRIKLIKRPENRKKGGNTCRNIGLENARGEYIIWFDADDLIAPYCLEQRVEFMERNLAIDFAVSRLLGFNNVPYDNMTRAYGFSFNGNIVNRFIGNNPFFVIVTNIYRRSALNVHNIRWDEDLKSHQDVDMNLECFCKKLKFKLISDNRPTYFWRLSGNPKSVSKNIYSESHLKTNLYYFEKQVNRFTEKKYSSGIYNLTNYIFKILVFQPDINYVRKFLSLNYFKNHTWLKVRLQFLNYIQHKLNLKSHIPLNVLTFMLMPLFEIRYRRNLYNWNRDQIICIKQMGLSK